MRRLAIVLIVAAFIVGGVIFFESKNNISNTVLNAKNSNIISATNYSNSDTFDNNEILKIANSSSNYNFSEVLNKEISGDVLSTELKSKNNGKYIIDFRIISKKLVLEGQPNKISDSLTKGNSLVNSINSVTFNN